jgi:hypothetical protein
MMTTYPALMGINRLHTRPMNAPRKGGTALTRASSPPPHQPQEAALVYLLLAVCFLVLYGSLLVLPSRNPEVSALDRLLVLLYAPVIPLCLGRALRAADLLLAPGAGGKGRAALESPWEGLLPLVLLVIQLGQVRMMGSDPLSLVRPVEGGRGGAEGKGRVPLPTAEGHAACTACLHPDGGPAAQYEETATDRWVMMMVVVVVVGGGHWDHDRPGAVGWETGSMIWIHRSFCGGGVCRSASYSLRGVE